MENKRIFLSSPTMHGEEQMYVKEAFDTNWVAPLGKNVDEFVSGICKAILLLGRILFKEPVTEDCTVTITDKDGFMVDTETAKQEFRQDIAQGIRQPWEYRVKFLGEDEATAKARIADEEIENIKEE